LAQWAFSLPCESLKKENKKLFCDIKDRRDQRQFASRIFLKFGKPCCLVFIFMQADFLGRGIIIAS